MKPTIRKLESGDAVVDFGAKWFVCKPTGQVITKIASNGGIKTRKATPQERLIALGHAEFAASIE